MSRAKAAHLVFERSRGAAQPESQSSDLTGTAFDHAQLARQRYLSLAEAAAFLRFPSPNAFWMWAKRQGLRPCKAGRLNLYLREDLERRVECTRGDAGQDSHGPKRTRLLRSIPRNPVTHE